MDDENDFTEVSIISNTAMNSKRKMSPLEVVRVKEILREVFTDKDSSSADEDDPIFHEGQLSKEDWELRFLNAVPERSLCFHSISKIPGILNLIELGPETLVPTEQGIKLSKSELRALSEYTAWTHITSISGETRISREDIEVSVCDGGYFMAAVRNSLLPPVAVVPGERSESEASEISRTGSSSESQSEFDFGCNLEQVECFECSLTGQDISVYYDEAKDLHHIQRGNHITLLLQRSHGSLHFRKPATSYSGNLYLVGYPDPEPQEQTLFVLDQKTLLYRGRYWIDSNSGNSSEIYFLKPHKELYPFLMITGQELYLGLEFQHRLYPIALLKNSEQNQIQEIECLVHLADRTWLCLETLKKAHMLIVDNKKLYQLLQVT